MVRRSRHALRHLLGLRARIVLELRVVSGAAILVLGSACGETRELPTPGGRPDTGVQADAETHPQITHLPGGVARVTLTANHHVDATGQGWHLERNSITEDAADSDFSLLLTKIVSLLPTEPHNAFCARHPAPGGERFERVEHIPGDVETCLTWGPASLGGNPQVAHDAFVGQAYLVKDRRGIVVSKLLTVSDSALPGAIVSVTFDIMKIK